MVLTINKKMKNADSFLFKSTCTKNVFYTIVFAVVKHCNQSQTNGMENQRHLKESIGLKREFKAVLIIFLI